MKVEFLWWEGCPSHPRALEELRAILEEKGLDPEAIEVREVENEERAVAERFFGSPTIRIEGEDVQAPQNGSPVGLTCRVYRLRDGRPSPTPDPDDVRELIERRMD